MFPHSSHETGLARRICFRSLRAVTAALLNQAKREAAKPGFGKSAVLLTHRGKPKAYVLEARAYEAMQRRISVLEGIALSEKDVRAGRLVSHPEAKKRLSRWLK